MKTIAHLSDLHFGRLDEAVLDPLRQALEALRPDLVVVSGDLTQRARKGQFEDAKAYLESLPQPQLVVPGNHDVPLYNVVKRFIAPLANYRKIVTDDLRATWEAYRENAKAHPMTDGPLGENIGVTYRTFGPMLYGDQVRAARAKAKAAK